MWTKGGRLYGGSEDEDIISQLNELISILEHGLDRDNFSAASTQIAVAKLAHQYGFVPAMFSCGAIPNGRVNVRRGQLVVPGTSYLFASTMWADVSGGAGARAQLVANATTFQDQNNMETNVPYHVFDTADFEGVAVDGSLPQYYRLNVWTAGGSSFNALNVLGLAKTVLR